MKSFVRWTGRVLVGFLAFIVLVYAVHGLWGTWWQVHEAKGDARETVRMLQRDTGITEQVVKDNRAALGEPERSWSQVVCDMSSNDSGWMVNDYTQRCSRQVVAIYPASVQRRAEGLEDPDDALRVVECPDASCLPKPVTSTGTTGFGSQVGTEPVSTGQADVGEGSHTVVTVHGPTSHSVLGCSPWGIVFCSEPVDQPVLPED